MNKPNINNNGSVSEQYLKTAIRVSRRGLIGNIFLSAFKLLAGILAHSQAMISDAVHSASDVLSTVVVMIGINISNKQPDKDHPYGHERMESVASIILAMLLAVVGIGIGYKGVQSIADGSYLTSEPPRLPALIAAAVSIVVKEWMYQYTMRTARKIGSSALKADAWHHRSDALSSIGSLIGIAGARLGCPVLDPIASLVICIFILKAAVDIFRDAADKMVDRSCCEKLVSDIRDTALSADGVMGIDSIMTRQFGSRAYVDMEITAEGSLSLNEAHDIAERVHTLIEETYPEVKHCMVHVNPSADPDHEVPSEYTAGA
ncbi:MAG: cation transporter [Parasporobacterium sp.]|nr:cation transporter [Parasporobacterium sp.]